MTFILAIVGRPNVGKSTLFNRLTGKRSALTDDTPGVTRDRREGLARLGPLEFNVVDTAGLEEAKPETLQARMTAMTKEAVKEADVVLLLIDGKAGVTPMDRHFADLLRKSKKPVVLAVNKADVKASNIGQAEAHSLGFGEPIAISAEHGDGMGELYEALEKWQVASGEWPEEKEDDSNSPLTTNHSPLSLAILGRPNVGKSTLFNRIIGSERTLTGPEAGITRDSITVDCEFDGKKIKLVDTAGMRKRANVTEKIEKLAVGDTLETLKFAEVVIWMIDATQPLEAQDNHIASLIEQEGRALVLAVNKWDEVQNKDEQLDEIQARLKDVFSQGAGITVVPISAKNGQGIGALLRACFKTYEVWNTQLGTGELNRWLEHALEVHTPPLIKGRRIKIRYMVQKSARPPSFILFSNISAVPEHYIRYLAKDLRQKFGLPGVPIRIKIRTSKNPYAPQ